MLIVSLLSSFILHEHPIFPKCYLQFRLYINFMYIARVARLEVNKSCIPVFVYVKELHHYAITCYIIRMTRLEVNESCIPGFVYAEESQLCK